MRRRTILTAAVAAAAAPAAALLDRSAAKAAVSYDVAICEQYRNQIQIYPSGSAWSTATLQWSFTPGTANGWSNLSDVKFRDTAAFGTVALVTASGGKVGMVNKTTEAAQELNDLLWSATPGNNPHAIERIPNIGAIVVAASGGYLHLYGPTVVSDPSTLALVQTISFPGAHGVWWDDASGRLWAIGQDYARVYTVSGTYRSTRLSLARSIPIGAHLGHSLDASYSDGSVLLATDGSKVMTINKTTYAVTEAYGDNAVKSYSQHSSGERFWVQATGSTYHGDTRNWVSPTVQFFDAAGARSFTRSLSYGAEFYKARLYDVAFH
ncbi:hypothetical protein ACGGAQ_13070 [Micromonospora sp. NPDC047557]|uniref:hypothetical protein n=1 Tax=Micromonospora sp. NPDC047557 TaxID=3364250 RepID=UPI003720E809